MDKKAWIISVNMGYGHQRTAFPLRDLAPEGKVIQADDYEGIPVSDKRIWEGSRKFYEFISNFYRLPLIGSRIFSIYDHFQEIFSFYPKKDLSQPNFGLKQMYSLFKKGWGKHLIEELKIKNLKFKINFPIISTFFIPAFMAEFFNYPGEIFCVICDADISRAWAPLNPKQSRIKYFASSNRVSERLKIYGVRAENIFLTGFPLPEENTSRECLKEDLKTRLVILDPEKKYFGKYEVLIKEKLGELPKAVNRPLTIMFSVGGAGAQKEIGVKIVKSLKAKIKNNEIKIILAAGIKEKVKDYFENKTGGDAEILYQEKIEDYFREFNRKLRETDILWTKPSELSFYTALGIPMIISPPIGSQEKFNMRYLLKSGFAIAQENPNYTDQWLFDWLKQGYLAEAAMQGFVEGEKIGTLNIRKIICGF
ncbi:MAG: hypothetical protein AAB451_02740 [Patescibacteria group bacterium]